MATTGTLTWHGDELLRLTDAAIRGGIDETTAAVVPKAKDRVRVRYRILQGAIQARPARADAGGFVGEVGAYDVAYAWWQEKGTRKMSAQPYLVPSAMEEFPKLPQRIRARMPT